MTHYIYKQEDIDRVLRYVRRHGSFTAEQGEIIDLLNQGKAVQERGWMCQSKKYPATRCIAMNPQVSDDYTDVTPLYGAAITTEGGDRG